MATSKNKPTYTLLEVEYMRNVYEKLKERVTEIINNPQDKYGPAELPNGRVVQKLIESELDQLKAAAAILEKLPKMLAAIDEIIAKEEAKVELRGKSEMSSQAEDWLKDRSK